MGMYNHLAVVMNCPRCGVKSDVVVDLYFGFCNLDAYRIGDRYRWREGKDVKHGGRPPGGSIDGEGYTQCPSCQKDFFVAVHVADDVVKSVTPDLTKTPHVPD